AHGAVGAGLGCARIDLPLPLVLREAERCGAVAVPCHPGRPNVGLFAHYAARGAVPGVRIVETLNGGSRDGGNGRPRAGAQKWAYRAVGGSAANIGSHIGRGAPRFEAPIRPEGDLVEALRAGSYEPV